ncbi:MAG: trehalose-phosphatase [Chloroflexota bacterium]
MTPDRLATMLAQGPAGLATDFDGTLSPIAGKPERARPLDGVAESLERLAKRLALVAVVSGRPTRDLICLLHAPGVTYVGNHGLECYRDGHMSSVALPAEGLHRLDLARAALKLALQGAPGLRLEDKGTSLAVHYRLSPTPGAAREAVLSLLGRMASEGLTLLEGRRVVELRIQAPIDKGTALRALAVEHQLRTLVFIGDDLTDLQGFKALAELRQTNHLHTLSVAVVNAETPRSVAEGADERLEGPADVALLLRQLAEQA